MANANLTLITTANTFGQWVTLTNNLVGLYNELLNGVFVGDNGTILLPNGSIILSNGTGTRLSVSGNVTFSQLLTSNTIQNLGAFTSQGNTATFTSNTVLVQVANTVLTNNLIVNVNTSLTNVTSNGFTYFTGIGLTAAAFNLPLSGERALISFSNNAFISANGNVYTNGAIVTGNANAAHSFAGNTTIGYNLTVTNNASAANATVSGILTAADIVFDSTKTFTLIQGNGIFNNVTVQGTVLGSLNVQSNVVATNVTVNNVAAGNIGITGVLVANTITLDPTKTYNITNGNGAFNNVSVHNTVLGSLNVQANITATNAVFNNVTAGNASYSGVMVAEDIVLDSLGSYSIINGNAVFNNVTVQGSQTIVGTVINSSSVYQLRSGAGTDGNGGFKVYRGPTLAANAGLIWLAASNVWQTTANDVNANALTTILTTANLVDSFLSTSVTNAATANAVNAAYSGAIANAKLSIANNGVFVAQRAGLNLSTNTSLVANIAANGSNTLLTDVNLSVNVVDSFLSTSLQPATANAVNAGYAGAIANAKLSVANNATFVAQKAALNFISDSLALTLNVAANATNTNLVDVHVNTNASGNTVNAAGNLTSTINDSGATKGLQMYGVTSGLIGGYPDNTGTLLRTYITGVNELLLSQSATAQANGNLYFRSLTSANVGDGGNQWSPWQTVITDGNFSTYSAPIYTLIGTVYNQANNLGGQGITVSGNTVSTNLSNAFAWTGQHIWSGPVAVGTANNPAISIGTSQNTIYQIINAGNPLTPNTSQWRIATSNGGSMAYQIYNDQLSGGNTFLQYLRSGMAVVQMIYGDQSNGNTTAQNFHGPLTISGAYAALPPANSVSFSGYGASNGISMFLNDSSSSTTANGHIWSLNAVSGNMYIQAIADGFGYTNNALQIQRTNTAITSMQYGNATDATSHQFFGTATLNGTGLLPAAGAGTLVAGNVVSVNVSNNYVWSGQHTWTGPTNTSVNYNGVALGNFWSNSAGGIWLSSSGAPVANQKAWSISNDTAGDFLIHAWKDNVSSSNLALKITRSDTSVTQMLYGDQTPTSPFTYHNFYGNVNQTGYTQALGVIATGGVSANSGVIIGTDGGSGAIVMMSGGNPANNKTWEQFISGNTMVYRTVNDPYNFANTYLSIQRSGTSIVNMVYGDQGAVATTHTFSGGVYVNNGLTAQNTSITVANSALVLGPQYATSPIQIRCNSTSPTANQNIWDWYVGVSGGSIAFRLLNDTYSTGNTALQFNRTGYGLTGISYGDSSGGTTHTFTGPVIVSGTNLATWITNAYNQANSAVTTAGVNLNKSGGTLAMNSTVSITGTMSAASYTATSDLRLKDNVAILVDTGKIVDGINPYTFTWKSDGTVSAGVIAQEVLEVFPEAVQRDSLNHLSVNYNALLAVLLGEVKDLRKRVAELEAR